MIAQIQKVVTQETIQREEFNGKYGAFLPDSISHDLVKQPIQLLYCKQESCINQNFPFIDRIEIKKQEIKGALHKISSKVFKNIPVALPDVFYHKQQNEDREASQRQSESFNAFSTQNTALQQ